MSWSLVLYKSFSSAKIPPGTKAALNRNDPDEIEREHPFKIIKSVIITYKQALRGLFAIGTSSFPLTAGETTEKVDRKQGLNPDFIIGMSS